MLETEIPKIIPIWKPVGKSTHRIAKEISEVYNISSSHTGTLDPMAQGVIVVLTGESRLKKYEYATWKKTYEFDVVLGLESDSLDGLGNIKLQKVDSKLDEKELKNTLESMVDNYKQKVPDYSAIKVKGKELHWWARNNKLHEIDIPTRSGEIYSLEILETKETNFRELAMQTIENIKLVEGDLRQESAINCWKNIEKSFGNEKTIIFRLKAQLSKGLYVRQLTQDILDKFGVRGITLNIKRTHNGEYNQTNCYVLSQIIPNCLSLLASP